MVDNDLKAHNCPRANRNIYLLAALLYLLILNQIFHVKEGLIGFDYSFFVPRLFEGLKFIKSQGWFPVPRYSISFCGALPFYGDPQNIFYSLTQVLTVFIDPLSAIKITIVLYLMLAAFGAWLLFNKLLKFSQVASLIGSLLFLCNGFLRSRILIGHFTFIYFSLIPLFVYLASYPNIKRQNSIVLLTLLITTMLYGGAHYMCLILGLSVLLTIFLLKNCKNTNLLSWKEIIIRLVCSGLFGILIGLSRLVASFSFISNFPRTLKYSSYGNFLNDLNFFTTQYFALYLPKLNENFWEYESSISIFAIVILLFAFITNGNFFKQLLITIWQRKCIAVFILILISAIFAFCMGDLLPNAIKLKIPIIKSMQLSYRFSAVFLLPIIILVVWIFETALTDKLKQRIFLGIFALLPCEALIGVPEYQKFMSFETSNIQNLHNKITKSSKEDLKVIAFDQKRSFDLEAQINGLSNPTCYMPIFSKSPARRNKLDRFDQIINGKYNLLNPACMDFPSQNHCAKKISLIDLGDQDNLKALTNYQNPSWKVSKLQEIGNSISVASVFSLIFYLFSLGVKKLYRRVFRQGCI